jgi:hypothetical protein
MDIHIVFEKLCCFSLEKRAASIDNTTFLMAEFAHIFFLAISGPRGPDRSAPAAPIRGRPGFIFHGSLLALAVTKEA